MRATRLVLLLALVGCAVVFVPRTAAAQLTSNAPAQDSKNLLPCAPANLKSGYSQDVKFFQSDRQVKVYDADYDETHKHDPICLSKKNNDAIFWVSGSGKKFKLKVTPQASSANCGRHPFKLEPEDESVDGYYSGPLRLDVPVGCVYDVEFQRDGEKPADPHIQITP